MLTPQLQRQLDLFTVPIIRAVRMPDPIRLKVDSLFTTVQGWHGKLTREILEHIRDEARDIAAACDRRIEHMDQAEAKPEP